MSDIVEDDEIDQMKCRGKLYRHYKGGIYEVICEAFHTEQERDMERLIIYRDLNNNVWARPYDMFHGNIEDGTKRFTELFKGSHDGL